MYAHINVSKGISRVLRYHENKLKQGKAQLIDGNTVKDPGEMTQQDKLYHFERRNSLNESVQQNTVHVLLSWPAGETVDNQRMRSVARDYLKEMKLEDQPHLVYRHDDREHPHLHIVCSNVTGEGKRLALHRDDYYRTHEIVEKLDLRYAQKLERRIVWEEGMEAVQEKRAEVQTQKPEPLLPRLAKTIDEVVPNYKYTNLDELNAVLSRDQLKATRGREESLTYQNGGLIYRGLSEEGRETGAYIKASVLDSQPTLKNLEERFRENARGREEEALRVRTAIDWAFYAQSPDFEGFRTALKKDKIETVVQRDGEGRLSAISYIDERNKAVFDGSSLGEEYSAAAIERRCEKAAVEREERERVLRQSQRQTLRLRIC